MIYVNDTNILIFFITNPTFRNFFDRHYFSDPMNQFVISIVTEGEIRGLAKSRNWGRQKMDQLELLIQNHLVAPIKTKEIIEAYAEIYAYS